MKDKQIFSFIYFVLSLINFNLLFVFIKCSVAEVLNQLNQPPNQRALLRNQRSLANSASNSTNAAAAATSALTLLNAAAVVAAAASSSSSSSSNRPSHHNHHHHHSIIPGKTT